MTTTQPIDAATLNTWELPGETSESRAWAIVRDAFDEHCGPPDPRDVATYITEAIEAAEADAAPRWVPVTERVPENSDRVLLLNETKNCTIMAHYRKGQWVDVEQNNPLREWFKPGWWQPLPVPPQEEDAK